jgi:hypothetical protein
MEQKCTAIPDPENGYCTRYKIKTFCVKCVFIGTEKPKTVVFSVKHYSEGFEDLVVPVAITYNLQTAVAGQIWFVTGTLLKFLQ